MKLTIISDDKAVYIDGISYSDLLLPTIPLNVHALQWKETTGWVEFNDGTTHKPIDTLPQWATDSVDVWVIANNPPLPPAVPALTYQELRAEAYPSIPAQLDMQYHDQLNGTTTWVDSITAVKAEFPKV
jgi:hypothetical protein